MGDRTQRARRITGALVLTGLAWMLSAAGAAAQSGSVLHADIEGEVITPVIADFLREGVERAAREGHVAYLIELDTPGGLDTSMREIVQTFLEAPVPVIVYVPAGGRAASAGAIIGMSAHVLAMAPATSIGAATPVDLQGGDISRKIINDAASYAEGIARARGRDPGFAVDAVRQGRSVSADEALDIGVIDLVARDTAAVLDEVDGRSVELGSGDEVTLATAGAPLVPHELSIFQRVRQRLADPNLAFIFLSIGSLALIYELANPGMGAGGVVGVILIVLGMFALSVLPVNTAGAVLMLLALALFIGEVFTPGIGVFAAGGVVSLILGGLFLFRGTVGVNLALLIPSAVVIGGGVVLAGRLAWRARLAPSATGPGQVLGQTAAVRMTGAGAPQAFVEGAWWRLHPRGGALAEGQQVRIVDVEGLDLIVEPVEEGATHVEGEGP